MLSKSLVCVIVNFIAKSCIIFLNMLLKSLVRVNSQFYFTERTLFSKKKIDEIVSAGLISKLIIFYKNA